MLHLLVPTNGTRFGTWRATSSMHSYSVCGRPFNSIITIHRGKDGQYTVPPPPSLFPRALARQQHAQGLSTSGCDANSTAYHIPVCRSLLMPFTYPMLGRIGRQVAWLVLVTISVWLAVAKAPDVCPGAQHKQHTGNEPSAHLHEHLTSRYEDPGLDVKQYASATAAHPHARRCDPRALVGRPRCGQLDFFKSNLTGHIYYSEHINHYFYEPDGCLLRRLSSGQAGSCLAQQAPLVFVGDSVTRYQVGQHH